MMQDVARRTILLVEDEPGDRAMVRRLLRDARRTYEIVEATSVEDGLARCREMRPDCVLLDYYLPDMSGRDFLDALASATATGGTPPVAVVVLTGEEDDVVATDALKRGAQDYISKDGVTGRGLVRVIENAIEKLRIVRVLAEQRAAMELQNRRLEVLRDELQSKLLELADATKAKDRFLAVMSHEMRTPLNAILGYADLLDLELEGDISEGQRHYLDRMRLVSGHLLGLINDVLDLTRADARKLELDMRAVDLQAVLEEVAALLEGRAQEKGVALVVDECEGGMPHVQADLHRLRQVVTNLVGNALKFTDEGSVHVRCRGVRPDGMVEIQVVDTGIGIEPDVLPLVFNEFYQASSELTRRYGGSGLGLAISRRLTELMGGELTVSSDVGHGSTFTIRLRAAAAGSELRPEDIARHDALRAQHAGRPAAVLQTVSVVAYGEDRDALLELARRVSPNVRLRWTTDADAVSDLAREERAALVVLDVGSAGGGAWRAALALQGQPELASTAVLLLPSLSAAIPDETSQVLDLGWVSLVPKPFTAEQLTQAVSTAAGRLRGDDTRADPTYDVLVVDDDPDSRRVAARFLEDAHLTVREASDGESALTAMRTRLPAVVVLDLMMPVLDGFGVLAAMRADPLLAGVPAVVLTAKSLTEAERQYLSRTAVRVLQKGEHRLADVAALVLHAAAGTRRAAAASS
jgi:signal transduction histidine kinase